MRLIIISGRSGSGKSVCLSILEDLGFYCISNLPLGLLVDLPAQLENKYPTVAVSIDSRNVSNDSQQYIDIIQKLAAQISHETIYLDADDEKLLERFSETRRKHPLSSDKISLKEALLNEKKLLLPIAEHADLHIDTSNFTISELRRTLRERVAPQHNSLSLLFQSFAYKHGVPRDSDYVFDVRCLPNPFWEQHLRHLTGKESAVKEFLQQHASVKNLLRDITHFLDTWIPEHKANDRNYLTISIGCTGGQHRSVYIAEKLYEHFSKTEKNVQIYHTELK